MRRIIIIFAALIFLISAQASAQSCYLSSECSGEQWCINKTCADSTEPLTECEGEDDCYHHYTCISGVCKPDGIYCENDNGHGIENVTFGMTTCLSGIGVEWMADMECMPGTDGCSIPSLEEMTTAEREDKFGACIDSLERECEAPPTPEDICSDETLKLCTDWVLFVEAASEACETEWQSGATPEGASNVSVSDTDEATAIGGVDNATRIDTAEAEGNSPQINGLYNLRGLDGGATPYRVVNCCEAIEDGVEDKEVYETFMACTTGLTTNDCAEIEACGAEMAQNADGYANGAPFEAREDDTSGGAKVEDEDQTVGLDEGDDADGESTNATDDNTSGGGDSGCSIIHPGSAIGSVLQLIL